MELVDEYHLQLCPTLVGGGRRLFPDRGACLALERTEVRTYDSGVVVVPRLPRRT